MKTLYHMDQWFKRPPGSMLLELAHQHIDPLLSKIPGDTAIQIGGPSDLSLLESCQHNLKCYYSFSGETTPNTPSIRGNLLQLPILPECCDLFILAHTLAFCPSPKPLLAQLYDSLKTGGLLLILGFNPISQFGLTRSLHNKESFPYSGKYHLPWKVKIWLRQAQFNVLAYRTFGFHLSNKKPKNMKQHLFLETFGRLLLSGCGATYMILAQKEGHGITPISLDWAKQPSHIKEGY